MTLRARPCVRFCAVWIVVAAAAVASAQTLNFSPVGSIPGQVDTIKVQGKYAYLAAGKTLTIFDISNPAAPKRESEYTFPEEIWAFRVFGTSVYVGNNFSGLSILDVTNPAAPKLRGSLKTPGQAKNAAVFGTKAFVVDHMQGLVLVDLSNPAKPVSIGSFFLDGYARDVTTSGSLAFAVDSPTGFYILDLSKPDPLEAVSSLQSGSGLRSVEASDPSAGPPNIAVLVGGGTLQVYDVTNPAKPIKAPPYRTPGGAQRVSLKGKLAYVADGAAGLQVVDFTVPSNPKIVGSYKTTTAETPPNAVQRGGPGGGGAGARDVAVADSLVLLVTGSEVLILKQTP